MGFIKCHVISSQRYTEQSLPPRKLQSRSWVTLDVHSSAARRHLVSGLAGLFFSPFGLKASVATTLCLIIGQAKKHSSLIPLFVFIGAGGTGAALYTCAWHLFNSDVSWDRKNNPEPWNPLGPNDQYKFYSVNVDYSKWKKEGPDF
ncbi:cytochrome c oxidase subunit NDUFA4-like [Lagenorhynchus albirostris]|uniref:cytochrome c oxidase subunit NDUFA4-like n=1 Tax=Lagenorhynchus albirostris TaxID=27610 RepID=UPI0028E6CD01|nr:cytochrome c oxidase subunit NDUFA4-like [Lagenorhynchus albirostris]